jgi:hypothetical protein
VAEEDVEPADRPVRWWQRVVPVMVLALVAGTAVLALADSSDEIALSTARQPEEYVELVLTRSPDKLCGSKALRVTFAMTSHLATTQRLGWQVRLDPAGKKPAKVAGKGEVLAPPDVTRGVTLRASAPSKTYDLTVTIPGRPERLRVHCNGASS